MKKNFVKTFAILAVILLAVIGFAPSLPTAEATTNAGYLEAQLTGNAQKLYTALETMANNGLLKTGTSIYDLTASGVFSANQTPATEAEYDALVNDFNLAVAVFEQEHPEVFYVDYDALTLRALHNASGKAKITIGPGKRADYFAKPFTSESAVNTAINALETAAAGYADGASSATSVKNKVKSVHDNLVADVTYSATADGCDTAYGALVNGSASAEGMAKAVKLVLDTMDIDALVVNGTINTEYYDGWLMGNSSLPVPTSWNVVNDGSAWYFVNAGEDNKLDENGGSKSTYFWKNHSATQTLFQATEVVAVGKSISYPVLTGGSANVAPSTGIAVNVNGLAGAVTKPTLIVEGDLSVNSWKMDDGTSAKTYVPLDVVMSYAEITSGALYTKYTEFFSNNGGSYDALSAYEIELYLAEEAVKLIETEGKALSVIFPYPAGYSYSTANTVYQAYVYDKYEGHTLSDHDLVDSIACVPTQYGLVVDMVCFNAHTYGGDENNFCNYAITAKSGNTSAKNVLTVLNGKGTINGAAIQTFASGSVNVMVMPDNGYVIDSVTINGVKQSLTGGRGAYQTSIDYASAGTSTVIEVNFVAQSVFDAEQSAGLFSFNSSLDGSGNGGNGGNGGSGSGSKGGGCFGCVSMSHVGLLAIVIGFVGVGKSFIR